MTPIAIAFHVARTTHSPRPFLLGFLSGGLGGCVFAILVTVLVFNSNVGMVIGSATIAPVLSAVGALMGRLWVSRNGS